jgi:hypothetical protein
VTKGSPRRRMRPDLQAAILAIGILSACGSDNSLSGSLDEVYRLQFDLVRARLYSSEFAVEYVVSKSGVVPLRVTISQKALRENDRKLEAGESYNIAEYGDITGRQADGTDIFRFASGKLKFDKFTPEQDAEVRGSFDAKFRTGDDVFTLTGDFQTELEIVSDSF